MIKCIYHSNWSRILARIMGNQVPFEAHLRDTTWLGKDVVYVLLITSILGRLPVVRAGDTGTIPFCYHSSCCNCAHCYNHDLFSADSSRGAGDNCPMCFVNSWVLGWSHDPWSAWSAACDWYYILLDIITDYTVLLYLPLLRIIPLSIFIFNTSLLRIITLAIVTYYYKIIITYYYIIISSL